MSFLILFLLTFTILFPYVRLMLVGVPIYMAYPALLVMAIAIPARSGLVREGMSRLSVWFWILVFGIVLSSIHQMIRLGGMSYSSYALMQRLLTLLVLPGLLGLLVAREGRFQKTLNMWSILAVMASIWCLLQVVFPGVMSPIDNIYYFMLGQITTTEELHGRAGYSVARAMAGMWNSNVTGAVLAISLPIVIARTGRGITTILMAMLVLGGIVATGSRQAMLGVFVCMLVLAWPARKRLQSVRRLRWAALALLLMLVLGFIIMSATGFGRQQVMRLVTEGISSGVASRWGNYGKFLAITSTDPLKFILGAGSAASEVSIRQGSPIWREGFVSNSWLLMMFEFGILGFLGFVGLFIAAWRSAAGQWVKAALAVMAWVMVCDNAMHTVFFTQVVVSLCLCFAAYTGYQLRIETWRANSEYEAELAGMSEEYLDHNGA